MDEIRIYRALMRASCSPQSGIGDIRDAVWKGVDEAGHARANEDGDAYGYINVLSLRISSMAAAVMLSCVIAGYTIVSNYTTAGALLSPYYDMLDGIYSAAWGIF